MHESRFINATTLALVAVAFFLARGDLLLCHAWTVEDTKSSQDNNNDAQKKDPNLTGFLQIVVGQGDLITLKEDLSEVKLANPAIADFVIISKRRIRLIGKQAGLTELSVKTQPNGVYRYNVQIVAPVDRAKIKKEKKFDQIIEIAAGHQRLLLIEDIRIFKRGLTEPLIALGDPSIADFDLVNSRRIRVIAKKAGLTDLMIFTGNDKVFHYEIKVVATEDRAKIKKEKNSDETIEIAAGQQRLLNLTKDIITVIRVGPTVISYEAKITLGDPSIADFNILDKRRIQVTAKKAGLTDLLVITSNDEVFRYEIKVTAPPK